MTDDDTEYGPVKIGPGGMRERQILRIKRRRPGAFDEILKQWGGSEAVLKEHSTGVPRKIRKRREPFVMVPMAWVERLSTAKHRATWPVACELLRRYSLNGNKPTSLPNGHLETKFRINRTQKWEALRELEQLGLIRVEGRPRKSPVVTILEGQWVAVRPDVRDRTS